MGMTCASRGCLVDSKALPTNLASRNALDRLLLAIYYFCSCRVDVGGKVGEPLPKFRAVLCQINKGAGKGRQAMTCLLCVKLTRLIFGLRKLLRQPAREFSTKKR